MGRPEFSRLTAINALASKSVFKVSSGANLTSIASGASMDVDIFAPPGTVAKVDGLAYSWQVGASTLGSRAVDVKMVQIAVLLHGEWAYNVVPQWDFGQFLNAPTTRYPASDQVAQFNVKGRPFSDVDALRITFTNNGNVADIAAKAWSIWAIAEKVG